MSLSWAHESAYGAWDTLGAPSAQTDRQTFCSSSIIRTSARTAFSSQTVAFSVNNPPTEIVARARPEPDQSQTRARSEPDQGQVCFQSSRLHFLFFIRSTKSIAQIHTHLAREIAAGSFSSIGAGLAIVSTLLVELHEYLSTTSLGELSNLSRRPLTSLVDL